VSDFMTWILGKYGDASTTDEEGGCLALALGSEAEFTGEVRKEYGGSREGE